MTKGKRLISLDMNIYYKFLKIARIVDPFNPDSKLSRNASHTAFDAALQLYIDKNFNLADDLLRRREHSDEEIGEYFEEFI